MIVVHVAVVVRDDCVRAFVEATKKNAAASLEEPGVVRFDVIQSSDDPTNFVLVEVYENSDAPAAHKATEHYAEWRDTVAEMMAIPRVSSKYVEVYPDAMRWRTPDA